MSKLKLRVAATGSRHEDAENARPGTSRRLQGTEMPTHSMLMRSAVRCLNPMELVINNELLLAHILQYLSPAGLLTASHVCRFWNDAVKRRKIWRALRLSGVNVTDYSAMDRFLDPLEPRFMDTCNMQQPRFYDVEYEMWGDFCSSTRYMRHLEEMSLSICPDRVIQHVAQAATNLRKLTILDITSLSYNFPESWNTPRLQEIMLDTCTYFVCMIALGGIHSLTDLRKLALGKTILHSHADAEKLGRLTSLEVLQLGGIDFQSNLSPSIAIAPLGNLRALTLCCLRGFNARANLYTEVLLNLPHLRELNLMQISVQENFIEVLSRFNRLKSLTIWPSKSNSPRRVDAMLRGVQTLRHSLRSFTWIVPLRFYRSLAVVLTPLPDPRGELLTMVRRPRLVCTFCLQELFQETMPGVKVAVRKVNVD